MLYRKIPAKILKMLFGMLILTLNSFKISFKSYLIPPKWASETPEVGQIACLDWFLTQKGFLKKCTGNLKIFVHMHS